MATYDPVEQRMAVRIVYDGAACAGKTTNLRQLSVLFAASRAGGIYSPAEMHGRTLYFDWMHITAGVVCGFPLLCQIVSVPGQAVLTPRRRHLLATADVVIHVCESTAAGVAAAAAGLAIYDEVSRERDTPVPLVIQANKQDQVEALTGAALLRTLGREGTPLVEAIASDGMGVVDTFVTAVRTLARTIQERSEKNALMVPVRRAETAGQVLARLSREQVDPAWAAEMLLEEAQAAFVMVEAERALARDEAARAAAAEAAADLLRIDPGWGTAAEDGEGPSLPTADVPTGFIWPAHTGRATLRALSEAGLADGVTSYDDGAVVHLSHGHLLVTSARARYAEREDARQALVTAARQCTQLGRLLVPDSVLVAQPARDGACWIWTVRSAMPTVLGLLEAGNAPPELLVAFGVAVVEALRVSLRHELTLTLTPESFGVQAGSLRYVGELTSRPPTAEELSAGLEACVMRIARSGGDAEAFVEAFERELRTAGDRYSSILRLDTGGEVG